MKAAEIIDYLEELAPLALQESYDNAGLLVGNRKAEIKGILISLDCTEDVIDDAISQNCNMIVSHHPVVFSGLKKFTGKSYIERTVIKAIKNDILLYAIHTNLDNILDGVNQKIADKLGLQNIRILNWKKQLLKKVVTFCPSEHAEKIREAMFSAGAGKIGNYDNCSFNTEGTGTFRGNENTAPFVGNQGEEHHENEVRLETVVPEFKVTDVLRAMKTTHPYEEVAFDIYPMDNVWKEVGSGMIGNLEKEVDALEFLKSLKETMQTDCVRYTLPHKKNVKRIAICGGSGSFLLKSAMTAKADVFITSDFKYHQFFDAENRIIIADIGHYESEQFTMELLADKLGKKFPTFAPRLTRVKTNPINYL
ncbi:MAG: Nif3-like dinuclear metal center hexameric protein [Flavobacteriales bacterium]|jgi:dinuclear metal center YbgI/SA1388 family protein|nr:Nif3-like dinuclear metal center hexameric protein [Flavobacteriales bacterium]